MKTAFYIVFILACAQPIVAQEWNQWRGPYRNGSLAASNEPQNWPEKLNQTWRVEVGEGYSSPVVSKDRIYISSRRDPDEIVMAINLVDGKVIWKQQYPASFQKNQYASEM